MISKTYNNNIALQLHSGSTSQPRRGIISITYTAKCTLHIAGLLSRSKLQHQSRQIDQVGSSEPRPSRGYNDERVLGLHACPARGQRQ